MVGHSELEKRILEALRKEADYQRQSVAITAILDEVGRDFPKKRQMTLYFRESWSKIGKVELNSKPLVTNCYDSEEVEAFFFKWLAKRLDSL